MLNPNKIHLVLVIANFLNLFDKVKLILPIEIHFKDLIKTPGQFLVVTLEALGKTFLFLVSIINPNTFQLNKTIVMPNLHRKASIQAIFTKSL